MKRTYFTAQTALLLLLVLVSTVAIDAPFGQIGNTEPHDSIELYAGDIIEILPVLEEENAQFAWVLTADRTFLQAGREKIFRTRIIEPGSYTLKADVQTEEGRIKRTFVIQVAPREEQAPAPTSAQGTFIRTIPALDNRGTAFTEDQAQIIRVEHATPAATIHIDTDTTFDSDGDGDIANDNDTAETFFETDRNPVYIWFANGITQQSLIASSLEAGNVVAQQEVSVLSRQYAREQGILTGDVRISTTNRGEGTIGFAVRFDGGIPTAPLLFQWKFGDGEESLIERPNHTYAVDGDYEVTVRVVNLNTGEEITNLAQTVSVTGTQNVPRPASSSSTSSTPTDSGSSSFILGSITQILVPVFIFLLLLGIGFFGVRFLLQRKKDDDEDQSTSTPPTAPTPAAPAATVPLSAPTPAQVVDTKTPPPEKKESENKKPEQTQNTAPAPAWLQAGMKKAEEEGETLQSPPAPEPTEPAPKKESKQDTAPDWLQKGFDDMKKNEAPKPEQSSPPPPPAPKAPPAPKPVTPPPAEPKPQTPPAPKPQPRPMNQPTGNGQKPAQQPVPAPRPAPAPTPTPKQTPPPAPKAPPAPKPVTPPPAEPKPQTPSSPLPPTDMQEGETIAVIRADSITPSTPKAPKAPTSPPPPPPIKEHEPNRPSEDENPPETPKQS